MNRIGRWFHVRRRRRAEVHKRQREIATLHGQHGLWSGTRPAGPSKKRLWKTST
jgi:hypothetical protein